MPLRPSPALPELLTPADVAAWLRTSPHAVYKMVARAQLPGVVRVGRRILFRRDALEHWLADRAEGRP